MDKSSSVYGGYDKLSLLQTGEHGADVTGGPASALGILI